MSAQMLPNDSVPPSCIEIGLQASKKGDFQLARQMLHTAMSQLAQDENNDARLIELIISTADTYLNEGNYDLAQSWYLKALHRSELFHGKNSLQVACLMTRLAEVSALQEDLNGFEKYLDNAQRAYLFIQDEDASTLHNVLIDLSWSLSVQGYLNEVKSVNLWIAQIKQLEDEDRITG